MQHWVTCEIYILSDTCRFLRNNFILWLFFPPLLLNFNFLFVSVFHITTDFVFHVFMFAFFKRQSEMKV